MEIVGISGLAGVGKDTVAKIFQLCDRYENDPINELFPKKLNLVDYIYNGLLKEINNTEWKVVKFSSKLKEMLAILLNVPVEYFEDRIFKEGILPLVYWNRENKKGKVISEKQWQHLDAESRKEYNISRKFSGRELMQYIGTDLFRDKLSPDVWVNALFNSLSLEDKILISDVRFKNEAERIKEHNGIIINIKRDVPELAHKSENDLKGWKFDYTINNKNEIPDLIKIVYKLYKEII